MGNVEQREKIMDGPTKGLSVEFYKREGDNECKIIILEKEDNKFLLILKKDKKTDSEKIMDKDKVMEFIKNDKNLNFVVKYLKGELTKQKGGTIQIGGRKRRSKKG